MKSETDLFLSETLSRFAGLTGDDIEHGSEHWQQRTFAKGSFYNVQNSICLYLGIVVKGIFRIYYYDEKTTEEKNLFFFSEGQFIVSFRSFLAQYPCVYYIEAMEDAEILSISYEHLQQLYHQHKPWERFGRLLAEHFFNQSQGRSEELLFLTHEQRYLNLLKAHPGIIQRIPEFQVAAYLGIKKQSLSRIKKRLQNP